MFLCLGYEDKSNFLKHKLFSYFFSRFFGVMYPVASFLAGASKVTDGKMQVDSTTKLVILLPGKFPDGRCVVRGYPKCMTQKKPHSCE
jgi:hypothetical protein